MKSIKTKGSQTFSVPNDKSGQLFLRLMKKYLNPQLGYRRRGRGPRPKTFSEHTKQYFIRASDQASLSPDHENCEWMAVYVSNTPKTEKAIQKNRERREALSQMYQKKRARRKWQDQILAGTDPLSQLPFLTEEGLEAIRPVGPPVSTIPEEMEGVYPPYKGTYHRRPQPTELMEGMELPEVTLNPCKEVGPPSEAFQMPDEEVDLNPDEIDLLAEVFNYTEASHTETMWSPGKKEAFLDLKDKLLG